ncbi:hypothetical protein [Flavobacterium daemonense]|uniref:hypothetical protein n=1 Tax=Flavobacterium daemonense TaxID=1393049 RepID=UPI001185CB25|nr:hypothetical protein [Flavobacterium daemonense]KAF2330628.1 hypothetical protein FND99_14470 [Flavobacterium daemonense]
MKKGEIYKEIFLEFDLNEINHFDYAVYRVKIPDNVIDSENLMCVIYCLPDNRKDKANINDKAASDILLATVKGQSSEWIEWKIDHQQLKILDFNKSLLFKIVFTAHRLHAAPTFNLISVF